jgi:hypothetical protein
MINRLLGLGPGMMGQMGQMFGQGGPMGQGGMFPGMGQGGYGGGNNPGWGMMRQRMQGFQPALNQGFDAIRGAVGGYMTQRGGAPNNSAYSGTFPQLPGGYVT